jgi:DNA-binding Lrp family transcriptional regulator
MTSRPDEDVGSGAQAPPLDDVDRAIVAALREDGRISMRALAARLHISRAGAYLRVQKLEEAGVITGYSAWVDPQRYGYGLSAYVHLKIAQPAWKPLRARLMTIPEVEHAALVSGDADIVLLVRARDITALRELVLNSFQSMPEVRSTQTVLIFDELGRSPTAAWPTGAGAPSPGTQRSRR